LIDCLIDIFDALMKDSMTNMLFRRKQANKGINGDKRIIKIVHSEGNETIGMLVDGLTQQNNTVQGGRYARKFVAHNYISDIYTMQVL